MIPLALPVLGTIAYKTYKYASKSYRGYEKLSKYKKASNNVGKFSKHTKQANLTTASSVATVGGGLASVGAMNYYKNYDKDVIEQNNKLVEAQKELNKPIEYQEQGGTLIDSLKNSSVNHSKDMEKMREQMALQNAVLSQNVDFLNATQIEMTNALRSGFENFPIVLGAVLTEIYSMASSGASESSSAETVVNVNATAPIVNVDMSSIATAVGELKSEINPQVRTEFYTKQNTISDYKTTPKDVTDLDGETVLNASPLEIQTKANATQAKKTTDENNFELDDEDFDMWDNLPPMDFLNDVRYSQIYEP